jgi:hypothetical protein
VLLRQYFEDTTFRDAGHNEPETRAGAGAPGSADAQPVPTSENSLPRMAGSAPATPEFDMVVKKVRFDLGRDKICPPSDSECIRYIY